MRARARSLSIGTFAKHTNIRRTRGVLRFLPGPELLVVIGRAIVSLDDVQRKATSVLHAGSAKDRAKRAGRAALLPDDLADVGRSDFEPKHSSVLIKNNLNLNGGGFVDQGLGDLTDKSTYLGDRV